MTRRLKAPAYGTPVEVSGKLLLYILAVVGLCCGILYLGLRSLLESI